MHGHGFTHAAFTTKERLQRIQLDPHELTSWWKPREALLFSDIHYDEELGEVYCMELRDMEDAALDGDNTRLTQASSMDVVFAKFKEGSLMSWSAAMRFQTTGSVVDWGEACRMGHNGVQVTLDDVASNPTISNIWSVPTVAIWNPFPIKELVLFEHSSKGPWQYNTSGKVLISAENDMSRA
jgi:hypothetical protein